MLAALTTANERMPRPDTIEMPCESYAPLVFRDSAARRNIGRWLDFVPAIALLIVSAAGIFVAALSPSGDRGQYAVVAPFSYNPSRTAGLVARAGGEILDFSNMPNVVFVHSDNPDFVRSLYHAGAWLVLDPVALRGCLGVERHPSRVPGV
jgi:hypothetical protein